MAQFGHFHLAALKEMHIQGLTMDIPQVAIKNGICGTCQYGKMNRLSFPAKSTWRAKEKVELIHSDVCGPMSTESLNHNRYFVLFIDDLPRMTWVYFLKRK